MPSVPVWTEPRLRLASLPLNIPRAGQRLTPVLDPPRPCLGNVHPSNSTEQRVRPQPARRHQGSRKLGTQTTTFIHLSRYKWTFKAFKSFLKT